jgi:hypothetical protein
MPPQVHGAPDIINVFDSNQEFTNLIKLTIRWIVNKTTAVNGIFGME